jgi:hypothetical protein
MAEKNCPYCGEAGRLASNHSLSLYKCRSCREEYEVNHRTCAYPSCASWIDETESGLCWFHAAQVGIHPEGEGFVPDHARPNEIIPAPLPDFSNKPCSPNFPDVKEDRSERPARWPSGLGRGEHRPSLEDPLCRTCGTPHHRVDGETDPVCEKAEHHKKREPLAKPSWPSGYPAPDDDEVEEETGEFVPFEEDAPSAREWFDAEEERFESFEEEEGW